MLSRKISITSQPETALLINLTTELHRGIHRDSQSFQLKFLTLC